MNHKQTTTFPSSETKSELKVFILPVNVVFNQSNPDLVLVLLPGDPVASREC